MIWSICALFSFGARRFKSISSLTFDLILGITIGTENQFKKLGGKYYNIYLIFFRYY
mgnify:CR=1 FL=1